MKNPLQTAIAKAIAASNVGLFRKQLLDKIDPAIAVSPNNLSVTLNQMKLDGYIKSGACQGSAGSRWSLTPKGRAHFSVLNQYEDDETDTTDRPQTSASAEDKTTDAKALEVDLDSQPDASLALAAKPGDPDRFPDAGQGSQKSTCRKPMKTIHFDTDDELDRGLYGIVELIRSAAEQPVITIERKPEKLALLQRLENNDLFPGNVRSLLGYIRMDIEALGEQ